MTFHQLRKLARYYAPKTTVMGCSLCAAFAPFQELRPQIDGSSKAYFYCPVCWWAITDQRDIVRAQRLQAMTLKWAMNTAGYS